MGSDRLRGGISAEEARGWSFTAAVRANTPDRRAVIIYKVGQFRRGRADVLEFDGVEAHRRATERVPEGGRRSRP